MRGKGAGEEFEFLGYEESGMMKRCREAETGIERERKLKVNGLVNFKHKKVKSQRN